MIRPNAHMIRPNDPNMIIMILLLVPMQGGVGLEGHPGVDGIPGDVVRSVA